jgi:hypothetical protein
MISIPASFISSISAGMTYSLKGWFGNTEEKDPAKSNFNWGLFTKNMAIGFGLGLLGYFIYPEATVEVIAMEYPAFYILQGFIDKLWTKLWAKLGK